MWGTVWQHVAWTSHHIAIHFLALSLDVSCQHFTCRQSVIIPYTSKGEHFSQWVTKLNCCGVLLLCIYLESHRTVDSRALCYVHVEYLQLQQVFCHE